MKKIIGYSSVVAGIIVLTAGIVLLYRLTQFRAEVDRLKSEGQPVSIADLNQPATEDGKQALLLFNRMQTQLTAFETEMFDDPDVLNRPVDEEMTDRFDELCTAYPDLYPLIDQLTEKSEITTELEGHSQEYIDTLLDRVQKFRSIARLLVWRMRVLTAQQKPDEAIATGLQIFRISQFADQHPTIVSHLVASAIRGMAVESIHDVVTNQPVSAEATDQLNSVLDQLDSADAYQNSLKSERPIGIEMLSEMGLLAMARNGKGYLDLVEDEIRNAGEESYQQDFSGQTDHSSGLAGVLGKDLLPAFQQTRVATARTRSRLRALRIIVALESHPEAATTPITQEYLINIGVPETMTVDTMTGEPMKVKRSNDHWVVYSVGTDLEDDGGSSNLGEDFSLGAAEAQ